MHKRISICLFFIAASLLLPAVVVFAQNVQFSISLKRGSTGQGVSRLQEFLKTMSDIYPEGLVTGYFGALTERAVKRFQAKYGIEQVGIVGPKTRARLNSLVSSQTVSQQSQPQQPQSQLQQPLPQQPPSQQPPHGGISVKSTGAKYKSVSTKPTTGWFKTGQDADILLSGIDFNNTGGPLLFNHPGEIASDGTRLLLADRNNNRVLIWNKLPTGNTPPDLVLGQPDFTKNNPGTGLNQFNWPSSVAVANGKVVVADSENDRILIWNTFPTQNAKPADLVLDLPTIARGLAARNNFEWPWGVWTDGTKLAVAATQGSRVLLWNSFPTKNSQLPDMAVSAQEKFGTPRSITSNGQYLIVGDHNAKVPVGPAGNTNGPATFFWKTWPLSNDQPYDFVLEGMRAGTFLSGDRLILMSTTDFPPVLWNTPPAGADDAPDLIIGNSAGRGAPGYYFLGGDSSDIVSADGRLYFSLANGNKIVGYNTVPSHPLAIPDFAIGAPTIYTNTLETNFILGNPVLMTDGRSLFASSDFEEKLYIWKNLPDESSADPDFVYDLFGARGEINFSPLDNALWGNTLVLAGRKTVYIWTRLPLNGEMPDRIITGKIGNVTLNNIIGVALDDKYFYLSDDSNKIYVWEGVPTSSAEPKFTLTVQGPGRLDSDGKYLVGVVNNNTSPAQHTIGVWNVATLSGSSVPSVLPTDPQDITRRFNGIGSVVTAMGHLLIADTGFGRVFAWRDINDALSGRQADIVLGAADLRDTSQEIGQNKLFWPASLAFDGSFLWVGEFKFSSRLLRFSIQP